MGDVHYLHFSILLCFLTFLVTISVSLLTEPIPDKCVSDQPHCVVPHWAHSRQVRKWSHFCVFPHWTHSGQVSKWPYLDAAPYWIHAWLARKWPHPKEWSLSKEWMYDILYCTVMHRYVWTVSCWVYVCSNLSAAPTDVLNMVQWLLLILNLGLFQPSAAPTDVLDAVQRRAPAVCAGVAQWRRRGSKDEDEAEQAHGKTRNGGGLVY